MKLKLTSLTLILIRSQDNKICTYALKKSHNYNNNLDETYMFHLVGV